jgi:ABC-type glycerol-3-phosphate transport system permease component
MDAVFGHLATNFSLDIRDFKKAMGITAYIDPNMTLKQITDRFDVPESTISTYLTPYIIYNGWFTILFGSTYFRSVLATVFVASISIIIGGFLSIATGSVLARFRKKWHMAIYNLYLLQVIIPPLLIIIPTYLIITQYLHLYNSYMSLIILFAKGGAVSTMIFTGYFSSLPKELKEAVYIDGGGQSTYFVRVILPLSSTPFATYTVVYITLFWNDLIYGYIFLKPEKYTIVPLLTSFISEYATNYQAIYSALLCSIVPMLLIYLVFQKLFIQSAFAGAIKE